MTHHFAEHLGRLFLLALLFVLITNATLAQTTQPTDYEFKPANTPEQAVVNAYLVLLNANVTKVDSLFNTELEINDVFAELMKARLTNHTHIRSTHQAIVQKYGEGAANNFKEREAAAFQVPVMLHPKNAIIDLNENSKEAVVTYTEPNTQEKETHNMAQKDGTWVFDLSNHPLIKIESLKHLLEYEEEKMKYCKQFRGLVDQYDDYEAFLKAYEKLSEEK